jgi:hypothetical protein
MFMNNILKIASICLIAFFFSCKKYLDVGEPRDKVTSEFVYASDAMAAAVLTGMYYDLQSTSRGFAQGRASLSLYCGLSSDEFNVLPVGAFAPYYTNNQFRNFWSPIYKLIYSANAAIEGLNASSISTKVKGQLIGEAKFLRAFCYFYLVNLYGDVPLLTGTDYRENSKAGRTPKEDVYSQIITDLLDAKTSLSEEYVGPDAETPTSNRVRPNKWCAVAFLARVYIYQGNWKDAEAQATELIEKKELYDTVSLENVFLKDSKEAIWQLEPISADGTQLNTLDAPLFILSQGKPNSSNPIWVGSQLEKSFEVGDKRKEYWITYDSSSGTGYFYFAKYKKYLPEDSPVENLMVLRIGEQYLIRSEARARQGKIDMALSDLNVIRKRADLQEISVSSSDVLVERILQERRVELFCEWGHRWFDLKRMGRIDDVMQEASRVKGAVWESYKQLYPIPIQDLKDNTNLKQNSGYPSS